MKRITWNLIRILKNASLALLVVLTLVQPREAASQYRVIGYYPMWSRTSLPPDDIKFEHLTHIMHAFAWPDTDGSIVYDEQAVDTALINATHRAGCKILLSFGGSGATQTANFALVTADTTKRRIFVNNIVSHLSTYHYDGADMDWEGPQSVSEKANEAALIHELHDAFGGADSTWLITMAVGVSNWSGQWHDFTTLQKYVDWFNAMTYDFHGSWSSHAGHNAPLYAPSTDFDGSVDAGIAYLHQMRGIPEEQLTLGLPFYGRRFHASQLYGPKIEPTVDLYYADVLNDLANGWLYTWDTLSQVPYAQDSAKTYLDTFDDTTSLTIKCDYAKAHNLSGVSIWALGQDITEGGQPLLEAVGKAMASNPTAIASSETIVPREYALLQNYPNPFNPITSIKYTIGGDRGWGLGVSDVTLCVYDVLGREVAVLVNETKAPGAYDVTFDGTGLASGVYIYRLTAGDFAQSRKMLLIK
jgi:chitinase